MTSFGVFPTWFISLYFGMITVTVISDCVTSYDLKKMDEMLKYYADKGCKVLTLEECMREKED